MPLAPPDLSSAWDAFWDLWGLPITILGVVVGAILAYFLLRFAVRRVVGRIVSDVKRRASATYTVELEQSPLMQARIVQRTRTIGTVLNTLLAWAIVGLAIAIILALLGVNATALVAVAGFFGAAAGVGAQALIKDVLSGLFMVFEDQLGIGDLVDLGEASGVVESVGIRVTQVRDIQGTVWFVRNGEIIRVGNKSLGWARALIDVTVPLEVDVDAVQERLLEIGTSMADEPAWRARMVETPEVWGIESITPEAVVVRLTAKTRPSAVFDVARELRARVRVALNEMDAKLPVLDQIFAQTRHGTGPGNRA